MRFRYFVYEWIELLDDLSPELADRIMPRDQPFKMGDVIEVDLTGDDERQVNEAAKANWG